MCRRGEDVILVTLNHIDTIRNLVGESEHHISLLDSATKTLVDVRHLVGIEYSILFKHNCNKICLSCSASTDLPCQIFFCCNVHSCQYFKTPIRE